MSYRVANNMTNCIWLLALVVAINARSLQVPRGYGIPHPPPHNPYYYSPYTYAAARAYAGVRPTPMLYNPPGSYYDSIYGVHKFLPGGGNPIAVDYVGLANL